MLEIRPVTSDDWECWREVRLAALTDAPEAFGEVLADLAEAAEARWRERLDGLAFLAIAFLHGEPVGQVAAYAPDNNGLVTLIALRVNPAARRLGVGELLVQAVIHRARSIDATAVVLSVWNANTAAIRFYNRFGFVASPEPTLRVIDGATWFRYTLH